MGRRPRGAVKAPEPGREAWAAREISAVGLGPVEVFL